MTIEPRTITAGEARFTYLEQGSGTPLVLLHGVGSAARSWTHQLAHLAHAFRVIAWDAPGYGGSTPLGIEAPDAGHYASALERLLAALGVTRLHLVGHSLGCVMAARFARLHPERILSLTLSGVATGHARLAPAERERLLRGRLDDFEALGARGMAEKRAPRLLGRNPDEAAQRAVLETMALLRAEGYVPAVRMLSGADTIADVVELPQSMPVQIIYGDADAIAPPEQNQRVAQARPSAPVHVLKGAGHALYFEQPEAFSRLLLEFAGRQATQ